MYEVSELDEKRQAVINWIRESIAVHGGRGSSAYYARWRHPWRGWSPPYPETTGYLIETLYQNRLETEALSCGQWLLTTQLPTGAFPALFGHRPEPSLFNSGMILFGLLALWQQTGKEVYRDAAVRAAGWMAGQWADSYPAYFSRAAWAQILAGQILERPDWVEKGERALLRVADWVEADGTVRHWGFGAREEAFTHTIAYTCRGLLEGAYLLENKWLEERARGVMGALEKKFRQKGRLAGSYGPGWTGDYRFQCVTGAAQLSLVFRRAGEGEMADALFGLIADAPRANGGVPGSIPFWGRYMPGKYPNWAAKFWLDASWKR